MSMVTEHGVKGYAPLSQNMSNTDTENDEEEEDDGEEEEEDEYEYENAIVSGNFGRKNHSNSNKSMNHNNSTSATTIIQENGRFYPLDETKNLANRHRNGRNNVNNLNLGYCSDDIPIMVIDQDQNDDLWKRPHMSFIRQFFLTASVLLCFATIIIFLYVLPCNDKVNVEEIKPGLLWDIDLRGIELHGPISVVSGSPYNLIFMFRGQLYGDEGSEGRGLKVPPKRGGVISMNGGNGSILWWMILEHLPKEMNCDNLSKDKSDCIISGENGLLVSVDQISGILKWNSRANTHSKMPVFLSDVDDDGIEDLLSVKIATGNVLGLCLISGKNGQLLGQHLRPDCRQIDIYSIDLNATVSYLCRDENGKQSMKTISLTEIFDGLNLPRVKKRLSTKLKGLANPFVLPERNSDHFTSSLTPFHQLDVQRRGPCPGDQCETMMNVTFRRRGLSSNDSRTIWSISGSNVYGMEPVSLTEIDKPLVTGFVTKFWQWNNENLNSNDNRMNSSFARRTVTEWTSVVIINQTEVHAVNASQSEIEQICKDAECQPSLKLQSQSLLVSDLNHDGFRELISYQASYELEKDAFVLKSRIQVVRLDVGVAKLTEIVIV